ncbi:lipid-binding serum glycoprotein family protein, partial [Prunus dulcis]
MVRMGSFTKFMASAIFFIVLSFFLVPTRTQEEGFISFVISSKGLEFSKDLLIEQAVSSIIPLQLPQIEKSVKIPLVGQVHVVLSNITIYNVDIASSYVETGDSDHGDASIQVEGMEVGVTLALNGQEGTLKLSVLECGCYVKDISIKLDGGASWLYQGLVDAFEGQIVSAVEDNISKKIREGIMKLDFLLQSLPKQIALDDIAALNVTFVGNPVFSNSSIEFQINGLFMAPNDDFASSLYNKGSLDPVPFNAPAKMVEISLHENVFSSVSLVFFNANYMQWVINKTADQSLLNTAGWKYIVPQLYKQYPNEDMELNISVSSPPIMTVVNNGINITVYSDVTIGVMDADEVIPVACISLEIHASCSPDILINKLAGTVKLNHVTAYLKWSKIGNLHMHLVQAVLSTILKTVVVPYVNLHLWKGLPLPLPHGFTLHNSEIVSINSRLTIFSDVAIAERSPTSFCYDSVVKLCCISCSVQMFLTLDELKAQSLGRFLLP